jgi:hypothetical protein
MHMALPVAVKGTSITVAPVLPVDDLAMEETGMILETGTAETVQDLAPMTDDDGRIPDLALRHLVAAFPYEVDEIPDHPFTDPAAAVAPLGPGAEADQHGRTRHIPDLPRDQGPGHLLPDQSLALDRVHEVLGEGVTPEVQLENPKIQVEALVLESRRRYLKPGPISLATDSFPAKHNRIFFTRSQQSSKANNKLYNRTTLFSESYRSLPFHMSIIRLVKGQVYGNGGGNESTPVKKLGERG